MRIERTKFVRPFTYNDLESGDVFSFIEDTDNAVNIKLDAIQHFDITRQCIFSISDAGLNSKVKRYPEAILTLGDEQLERK